MNEFGNFESIEEEKPRMKMEGEEPEGIESPKAVVDATIFEPGEPLEPLDTERIQSIRDFISSAINESKTYKKKLSKRNKLKAALYAVCTGASTILSASKKYDLPRTALVFYMQKARLRLGKILPPQKCSDKTSSAPYNSKRKERVKGLPRAKSDHRKESDAIMSNREDQYDQYVTIDGITVPNSIGRLSRLLALKQINYSKARRFNGNKTGLRKKLIKILESFPFVSDVDTLADGMILVFVDGKSISESSRVCTSHKDNLARVINCVKVFIDFSNSPCTHAYQHSRLRRTTTGIEIEPPQPLPIPPERMTSKDWEIKEEEMEEEEPIEPPLVTPLTTGFLTAEDQLKDEEWNGEGYDYITRKMMTMYDCDGWKFDDNGENNADLLPTLLQPRNSEMMERLKCVIQYVVNDRNSGLRERLYIRPVLIHHFCNGIDIDYLLNLYKHRIPLTQVQLQKYCTIITNIYKKTSEIVINLNSNHSKCSKILHEDEMKREELMNEMRKKFPFLFNSQCVPPNAERLTEEEYAWGKSRCDVYMYYTLIAVGHLRDLGFLLTESFIDEIAHFTVRNISSSVSCSEEDRDWAIRYIATAIETNKKQI